VSDHLPVYVTLPHQFAKCKSRNRFELKRVYSTTNIEQFKNKLSNIDWSLVYDTSDVDEKYTCFLNIITDLHNTCFPLTSVKINPMKDSKPWISLSILNSVKKKNSLYKQYLRSRSDRNLNKYKQYKNKLTTILRQAEKDYFSQKILEAKDSIAKTWKVINRMTNRGDNKSTVKKLEIGNTVISDPAAIANKFNAFFVNIGSDLVKKIPRGSNSPADFLTGNYCKSLFFSPTTAEEITDIVNNLKNSNSTGVDGLSVCEINKGMQLYYFPNSGTHK
jgi:hypothetical protein